MRKFLFIWYKNEKYNAPRERSNKIVAADAQTATNAFIQRFGNLKKNTIKYIQEIDEEGNSVGEPIVPDDDSKIVPIQ